MKIVGIAGSPTAESRSSSLLQWAQAKLQHVTSQAQTLVLRELPAEALLHAQFQHPVIRQALSEVHEADVVLVATPIYKAAYSGLLKSFLDLLPQDGLTGKTVLPLATGGSIAHLLALDYALKPVLSALGARDILSPVYATDAQMPRDPARGHTPDEALQERLSASLHVLIERAEKRRLEEAAQREREARAGLNGQVHPTAPVWQASDLRWSL